MIYPFNMLRCIWCKDDIGKLGLVFGNASNDALLQCHQCKALFVVCEGVPTILGENDLNSDELKLLHNLEAEWQRS
jgi:hypothetical protein